MGSACFIEDGSSDMQPSELASGWLMCEQGYRIESASVFGDHDGTVACSLELIFRPEGREIGEPDRSKVVERVVRPGRFGNPDRRNSPRPTRNPRDPLGQPIDVDGKRGQRILLGAGEVRGKPVRIDPMRFDTAADLA